MSNHVRDKRKADSIELYSVLSSSGHFRYISSNCMQFLGYKQEELIGKDVRSFIHKEDIFLLESFFYNDHHLYPCAFRFRHKENHFVWLEASVDFIQNEIKENEREVIVKIKIIDTYNSSQTTKEIHHYFFNEQKSSSSQINTDEETYSIIESLPSPIFISYKGIIKYVNQSFLQLLGVFTREQVIGKSIYDYMLPDYHEVVQNRIQMLHEGQSIGVIEQEWRREDGFIINVECRPSTILFKGRKAEIAVLYDISSRKRVQKNLQKSRERYQKLIQNSIDTIGVIHNDKWVFINESGLRLFGVRDYAQIIGKNIYSHLERDSFQSIKKMLIDINAGKKEVLLIKPGWRRKTDGQTIYTEMVCIPTTYFGEPAVQVILRDLTERKNAENMMVQSEKLTIAGQLAAGIAHEIRNPLTAIKGFLQLMQSERKESDQYFDIVFSELNRIELILSELLMLAKPQEALFKQMNMSHVLTEVITLLETEANLNNVMIQKRFSDGPDFVHCDPNQLKQVFINLIKNAIEAMPSGGAITIETICENDTFTIHFVDTGEGIPEDILQKIGQPFVTTKESGNGLGLMMTFKIIENHKGTIQVESEEGKGTKFTISLPIAK